MISFKLRFIAIVLLFSAITTPVHASEQTDYLPGDLWGNVFSYISNLAENTDAIERTCKKWRLISSQYSQNLQLTRCTFSVQKLSRFVNCKFLSLDHCKFDPTQITSLPKTLKHLKLINPIYQTKGELKLNEGLEALTFEDVTNSNDTIKITLPSSLTHLTIISNGLSHSIEYLSKETRGLQSLCLVSRAAHEVPRGEYGTWWERLPDSLKTLMIEGLTLDDVSWKGKVIKSLPNSLERLELRDCIYLDDSFSQRPITLTLIIDGRIIGAKSLDSAPIGN